MKSIIRIRRKKLNKIYIEFIHPSFQEYFASKFIINNSNSSIFKRNFFEFSLKLTKPRILNVFQFIQTYSNTLFFNILNEYSKKLYYKNEIESNRRNLSIKLLEKTLGDNQKYSQTIKIFDLKSLEKLEIEKKKKYFLLQFHRIKINFRMKFINYLFQLIL